ncbi:MAG: Rrf2 family transcriptional regulator [Clostridia bacterium]|nr:Rrf2 family transcriptional regulator [Clostridia bacterium]MBQ3463795.1 Rrf2 family transcriptional regulator [Clostridia bacterium]MBQ6529811.1 Rrf2 family transcriptional regulator [Clostridia bacterium]MBR0470124.1 Rrf2 family transcriptional regulator [Clostridia bacterium]
MKISTKGRYALRLMLDIAIHGSDTNVSIRDVAERQDISVKYLEQIVSMLVRVGYLRSIRGAQGGYRLAGKPSEYTVGDVLRITEGSLAPVSCLDDKENLCERAGECVTLKLWEGLYDVINKYVDSITLEDLINETVEGNGAVDFCI